MAPLVLSLRSQGIPLVYVMDAHHEGSALTVRKDMLPGHICCILVVREQYARIHGDVLRDYLQQVLAANESIRKDLHRSAQIQEKYTGVPASIVKQVLDQGDVSFDHILSDRSRIESLMRLAIKTGVLNGPCDLNTFLQADLI